MAFQMLSSSCTLGYNANYKLTIKSFQLDCYLIHNMKGTVTLILCLHPSCTAAFQLTVYN